MHEEELERKGKMIVINVLENGARSVIDSVADMAGQNDNARHFLE